MHYNSTYPCSWDGSDPKQLLVGLLIPMVELLWALELDGRLEETASRKSQSSTDPKREEDAQRCQDPVFRREALAAASELLFAINAFPGDLPAFGRMNAIEEVTEDVAREFEGDLWVILVNYAFLLDRNSRENGRKPGYFVDHAVRLLEMELERAEAGPGTCACCGEPAAAVH